MNVDEEMPTATAKDPAGQILGDFRLLAKLGEGGMGAVYKALQISMDRVVAVKILSEPLAANPDFVERFRREARMSAKLDHPNVVRGITVGADKGFHYFAMEFVDGENLADVLHRVGRLPVSSAVRIALDVARALAQAEQRDMVHRDIKPANIILSRDGVVKLADLGLAKVTSGDQELSVAGVYLGTPPYMAPEQFENSREVDQRSDIYSLGATLYHLLAGRKPFQGSVTDVMVAKTQRQWTPSRTFNPAVPEALDRIIARMMEPSATDRYQSAAELVADLEAVGLAGCDVTIERSESAATLLSATGVRPATDDRVGSRSRRPRWYAILTVALLAAAIALYTQLRHRIPPSPMGEPEPQAAIPANDPKSASAGPVLARAFGELANDGLDEARDVLRRGLAHPTSAAAIKRPLREIEEGALILLQRQTPQETLPLAPIWEAGDLMLTQQDNYRFAIVTAQPCFLYAFDLDQRPSVSRLFPNTQYSALGNPIASNTIHWLPAKGRDGSWFYLDQFKGTERLFFVGLTRPLRDPDAFSRRLLAAPDATVEAMRRTPDDFVDAGAPVGSCSREGPVQELRFTHN